MLPTLADVMGVDIPNDYEINGRSFWPYLTTDAISHRDWIYANRNAMQLVRGKLVMMDGRGKWWDVSENPEDLISFTEIKDWKMVSPAHRKERDMLLNTIVPFDKWETEHDAPGYN